MSVLHPVGPEPEQTYWVRRALVIGAAIVILAVVIVLVVNGMSTGSAVQQPRPLTATVAANTASPSASAVASPTSTQTPTPSAVTPSAKATATASASPSARTSASASPTAIAKPVTPDCDPAQLRATLTGKKRLKPNKPNAFSLSLINGSGKACLAKVTGKNFELKIYSGTDRIWSTDDCTTAIKSLSKKLDAEEAVEWSLTWDGSRSQSNCKQRPEIPRPGTYFATAQLDGAKPVQLRMILT